MNRIVGVWHHAIPALLAEHAAASTRLDPVISHEMNSLAVVQLDGSVGEGAAMGAACLHLA